jgi:hypothetical protein
MVIKREYKKGRAFFIILNLILSVIAFAIILSLSSGSVHALTPEQQAAKDKADAANAEQNKKTDISTVAPAAAPLMQAANPPAAAPNPSGSASNALTAISPITLKSPLSITLSNGQTATINSYYNQGGKLMSTVDGKAVDVTEVLGKQGITPDSSGAGGGLMQSGGIISTLFNSLLWGGVGGLVGSFMGGNGATAGFIAGLAGGITNQLLSNGLNVGGSALIKPGFGSSTLSSYAPIIGIGVAIVVFIMLYKKESKQVVTFTCMPWQAPVGGADCEKCNGGIDPCSEYKCRALGQSCQLLNAGSTNETCTWVNRGDVNSAIIQPWPDVLTKGYQYTEVKIRPPGTGMRIIQIGEDACVKTFTPLNFGIETNEPTQCKIDYNHTQKFSQMQFYFGETDLYLYNHSEMMRLPGPTTLNETGGIEILNDGTFTLYIRCRDANGNENNDEYAVRFCVDKGPDTTPPEIEGTNIANDMPIKYNQTSVPLEVYVNEPSTCKWSREDRSYDNMENNMSCATSVWEMNNNQVYTCATTLTGLKDREDNEFYFRCKDQPYAEDKDRNTNQESYKYTLKGTEPLNIVDIEPNGTVSDSTDVVTVNLKVETENGNDKGNSICYYSRTGNEADFVQFYDTGKDVHNQKQDLTGGTYTYYVKCVDLGGNRDDANTTFTVSVDRNAPIVVRVYNSGGDLKIVTDKQSTCSYSQATNQKCDFDVDKGTLMTYVNSTQHYTAWTANTYYYIKCQDKYGNQPLPTECSLIVQPFSAIESKS